MVETDGAVWRAVHVHRYTAQDAFLTGVLTPVLAPLRASGVLRRSFFLRYWQGGPHIRVRLLVDPARADSVQTEVAAQFRVRLTETPVDVPFDVEQFHRDAQPTLAGLEGGQAERVYPPDTVRPDTYRPEFGKYGGPRGVAIAEELFDVSSAVVLAALPGLANSGRRLGAGFTAMVHGMHGAGLTAPEMADFLRHYCVLWSPYVFDQFLAAWPDLLTARRPALRPHVEALLARPGGRADPFGAAVRTARAAQRADADVLPAVTLLGDRTSEVRRRQVLLVSYLHTHNNRLGLIPEQEAFLGYLGHHVLSEYAGQAPCTDLLPDLLCHRAQRLAAAL